MNWPSRASGRWTWASRRASSGPDQRPGRQGHRPRPSRRGWRRDVRTSTSRKVFSLVNRPSRRDLSRAAISTKIVIAGGSGVGKTTFVRSISEIEPVTAEALMTEASAGTDDLSATPDKTTTNVAGGLQPDQPGRRPDPVPVRYAGAGAVLVLVGRPDLRRAGRGGARRPAPAGRLFPAIEYFENVPDAPFVVALNCFDGILPYELEDSAYGTGDRSGGPLAHL